MCFLIPLLQSLLANVKMLANLTGEKQMQFAFLSRQTICSGLLPIFLLSLWVLSFSVSRCSKRISNVECFQKGSIKPLYMIRKCISMSSFIVNNISKLYLKVKHIRSFFLVDDKEFQSKHLPYGQSSLSGDPTKLSWHVLFPILKGSHLKLPTHQPTPISADETALTTLRR